MERHITTHYLSWKLQPSTNSFQPPPFFQESFVWPPRSYSCSFCRREFRSAQALGGHMNVHRRDRARLKQSPPPPQAEARIQESSRISAAENPSARTLPNEEESGRRSAKHAGGDDECGSDSDGDEFAETNVVCKRHKLCSSEKCSSMAEEIDLELRLGAPAVKIGQIS